MRLERFVASYLNSHAQSNAASSAGAPPPGKGHARMLVASGDVRVNGSIVRDPGWQVFMGNGTVCDLVQVRGETAPIVQAHRLFVLHKPRDVLGVLNREVRTGFSSGGTPASLADLVPPQWWSSDLGLLGRLDRHTTGLCILSRRECAGVGALLLHPEHHVSKAYLVDLAHNAPLSEGGGDGLHPDACSRVAAGLRLADGTECSSATLEILSSREMQLGSREMQTSQEMQTLRDGCTCSVRLAAFQRTSASGPDAGCRAYTRVRLTIRQGRFHQVKRMMAQLGGYGVHRLHRESFGSLSLEDMQLPEGTMRPMTDIEYAQVQAMLPPSRACPEREHSSRWLGAGGGTTPPHAVADIPLESPMTNPSQYLSEH